MDSSQIRHNNVLSILNIIRQFFEVDHQCQSASASLRCVLPIIRKLRCCLTIEGSNR